MSMEELRANESQGEVYKIHGRDEKPLTLYAQSSVDGGHTWYRIPSWPVVFLGFEEFDIRVHHDLSGKGWTISEATTGMSIVKDTDAHTSDGPCVTVGWMISRGTLTVEKIAAAIVKAKERLAALGAAARPEEKPIDLMAELRKKLPQGMPVAWRYRLKPKPGKEPMAWKYVDRADEVNPLDAYESEPMYSASSPQKETK